MTTIQDYIDDVVADGPLLYWPLLEESGSTAYDESGNGLDGAVDTGGTWNPANPSQTRGLSCFYLPTGSTNVTPYLSYTGTLDTNNGVGFSIEFWLKATGFGNYSPMLYSGAGWGSFVFEIDSLGGVFAGTSISGWIDTANGVATSGSWAYWVFTQDSAGSSRLYKNGALLGGPNTQTHPADLVNLNIYHGGITGTASYWQHLAVHPTVLTSTQVSDRYALVVDEEWNLVPYDNLPLIFDTTVRSMPPKGATSPSVGQIWPR